MSELLIFSDDWGRHPSSCQHLTKRFLEKHDVTWVNTIGMRPPRFDLLTVKRVAGKLRDWSNNSHTPICESSLPPNLNIIDAKMWPWIKRPFDRWLNKNLLTKQLREVSKDCIAITTIPIVSNLIGQLPVKKWVYYCVDDFSAWPGLDGRTLLMLEDELIAKTDDIVCVSENLVQSVENRGRTSKLLTHGVDSEFWRDNFDLPLDHFGLPRDQSFALFWGVVDRRMDADWLIALANQLNEEKIILAGPMQDPDPRLLNHDKIKPIGSISFTHLPSLAKLSRVLVMPYADLPVTRAMQPLKLKEYLATMKPVVASALPAVQPWSDCLQMVSNKEQFIRATIESMRSCSNFSKHIDIRERRLRTETWDAKAAQFEEWAIG